MRYIHDTGDFVLEGRSAVTIGKFDGLHLGHRRLIREVTEADCDNRVLFTFSTSPQAFLDGRESLQLLSPGEKLRMAEELGIDTFIEYPFDDAVRRMPADRFLKEILSERLHTALIAAGPDCRFGYRGQGDVNCLAEYAPVLGYRLQIIEKECFRGAVISSSRIRTCLQQGEPEEAACMLGYPYYIEGTVLHGRALGRTIGVPTINLAPPADRVLPRFGVYAARVTVRGRSWSGMTNVGRKPSVGSGNPVGIETHLLDFEGDLYGETARVDLLSFIRPEQSFDSLAALSRQIGRDREEIRRRLDRTDVL